MRLDSLAQQIGQEILLTGTITLNGTYVVDSTIHQFLPEAAAVYGPQERYPLRVAAESMNRVSYVQLPG